jgi:hypothetical protein
MTGDNFSDWFNPSEGTTVMNLYREYEVPSATFKGGVAYRNSTNSGSRMSIGYLTEDLTSLEVWENGDDQIRFFPESYAGVRRRKVAGAYKKDDFSIVSNSSSPTIGTSGNVPSGLDYAIFGSGLGGTISELTYYPVRLPNSTLQTLTK